MSLKGLLGALFVLVLLWFFLALLLIDPAAFLLGLVAGGLCCLLYWAGVRFRSG